MTQLKYDNSGVLFKNSRKEKPSHPDYEGSASINGRELWISAWIKEGQKGKFMSLAFKPKEAPAQAPAPRQAPQRYAEDERDRDVPF